MHMHCSREVQEHSIHKNIQDQVDLYLKLKVTICIQLVSPKRSRKTQIILKEAIKLLSREKEGNKRREKKKG